MLRLLVDAVWMLGSGPSMTEGGDRHWTARHQASFRSSPRLMHSNADHSSQETPDSTLDGIGSFSHSPFSFLSQTPSFGMTKR